MYKYSLAIVIFGIFFNVLNLTMIFSDTVVFANSKEEISKQHDQSFISPYKDFKNLNKASHSDVLEKMSKNYRLFLNSSHSNANVSRDIRKNTVKHGQNPYAVIVTCSDSRVIPEFIFGTDIGDIFVVRVAGNVIGSFILDSVEYGVKNLNAKVVIVMGHTNCGAVEAALNAEANSDTPKMVIEIQNAIGQEKDPQKAQIKNVKHSIAKINKSEIIKKLSKEDKIIVEGIIYHTDTGKLVRIEN